MDIDPRTGEVDPGSTAPEDIAYEGTDPGDITSKGTAPEGIVPVVDRKWLGIEQMDCSEMDSDEVLKLMYEADNVRRRMDGYMMTMLSRLRELGGESAVRQACHEFGLSRYHARRDARTVEDLKDLPRTLEAVSGGLITKDHARLIGESHRRERFGPAEEQELIWSALSEGYDDFRNTVARYEQNRCELQATSKAERQRRRRKAALFNGDDGMVVLHAELDPVSGERVKTALDGLCDRMYRDDFQSGNDRTYEQRCADALVNLVAQTPNRTGEDVAAVDADADEAVPEVVPQATTLLVKVDYDALTGRLKNAALIDDTPIDLDELRRIACDAGVIPAIFSAEGMPLYLGRRQRAASQTQKLALQVRDKHCKGCGIRATACEAHHIIWWQNGGTTDIANLKLLCPKCHTKVHEQNSQGQHQYQFQLE